MKTSIAKVGDVDTEEARRRALGKVYALLLELARQRRVDEGDAVTQDGGKAEDSS
jgi:hypothetical protein